MAKTAKIVKTNTVQLMFPFNREIIERIKKMSNRKYDAKEKAWDITVDFRNCFELERIIKDYKFIADSKVPEKIAFFKQEAKDLVSGVKQKVKILSTPERIQNSLDRLGFTLRDYQKEGWSTMAQWKKAINGDDMGLGKTLQTITAVEHLNAYPCLIICPASLKYNWLAEINQFLPDCTCTIIDSKTIIYSGSDFYIINYDITHKKKKELENIQFKCVVADESHYIKNKKAKRSAASIALIKKIPNAFLLSGTMIENRPSEVISQIEALEQMAYLGGYWSFIHRYCDAKSNGFGLDLSGAKNIEELHLRMSRKFYIRRNKKDVLKELPDKVYTDLKVDISNIREYNRAEANLVSYLQEKVLLKDQIKKETKGMTKEEKKNYVTELLMEQEDKVSSAEHLVLMSTLRKISASGKIDAAKEYINNFLDTTDKKIVVFAWHTEVVKRLMEEFGWNGIYGDVDPKLRQQYINTFQKDPKVRGIVMNIKAGGVGLTATAADTALFIEEPYNPGLKAQAEDRIHRIGQKLTANILTMIGRGTIDEDIHSLLAEKMRIIRAVNAGEFTNEQNSDINIMKELLNKLMER